MYSRFDFGDIAVLPGRVFIESNEDPVRESLVHVIVGISARAFGEITFVLGAALCAVNLPDLASVTVRILAVLERLIVAVELERVEMRVRLVVPGAFTRVLRSKIGAGTAGSVCCLLYTSDAADE